MTDLRSIPEGTIRGTAGRIGGTIRGTALALLLALAAGAAESIEARAPVSEIWVIDGDTIEASLAGRREKIRLPGIDAPESRVGACAAEIARGKAATREAVRIVRAGREAVISAAGETWPRDRFGRVLADVAIDGSDLGKALLAAGHALAWAPGPAARAQRQAVWCGR